MVILVLIAPLDTSEAMQSARGLARPTANKLVKVSINASNNHKCSDRRTKV